MFNNNCSLNSDLVNTFNPDFFEKIRETRQAAAAAEPIERGSVDGSTVLTSSELPQLSPAQEDYFLLLDVKNSPFTPPRTRNTRGGYSQSEGLLTVINGNKGFSSVDGQTSILVYGGCINHRWEVAINNSLERLRAGSPQELLTLGGVPWEVKRSAGGGGYNYRCRLVGHGLELFFATSPGYHGGGAEIPLCRVVFGWELANKYDLREVVALLFDWLQDLGASDLRYHIQRLDLQLTTDIDVLSGVADCLQRDRVVTRCAKVQRFENAGKLESATWRPSTAGWVLRIYNKWQETIENASDGIAKRLFLEELFGADIVDVQRVEFQYNRELLRALDVHTFDDLTDKAAALLGWSMQRFVRFIAGDKGNNHSNIVPWADFWKMTLELFTAGDLCGRSPISRNEGKKDLVLSPETVETTYAAALSLLARLTASAKTGGTTPINWDNLRRRVAQRASELVELDDALAEIGVPFSR